MFFKIVSHLFFAFFLLNQEGFTEISKNTSLEKQKTALEARTSSNAKSSDKTKKSRKGWLVKGLSKKSVKEDSDPLEFFNRPVYEFNRIFVDGLLLKPMAVLYRDAVHEDIKTGIGNFLENIFMPLQFINHLLQGEVGKACHCLWRFFVNTTTGVLGIADVAKDIGLPNEVATFNHTLAKWGFDSGPYIMLPILGPTTLRGAFGLLGDYFMNPLNIYTQNKNHSGNEYGQQKNMMLGVYGVDIVRKRSGLIQITDDIDRTSKDPYVSIRNYIIQAQEKVEKEAFSQEEHKEERRIGMIVPTERS